MRKQAAGDGNQRETLSDHEHLCKCAKERKLLLTSLGIAGWHDVTFKFDFSEVEVREGGGRREGDCRVSCLEGGISNSLAQACFSSESHPRELV